MDFQSNKINQPFNPSSNYFQGLSNNIQSRVGIEVKNVVETKAPQIEFNKKQKPIQLTVEFGFPLSAEKNIAVESIQNQDEKSVETNILTNQIIDSANNLVKDDEIGQIHIEPIQLAANQNPYWHNFNSDDELEGLVLDSEGQEMSDITINGDAMFDIDQHFLQKEKTEIVINEVTEVINEIIEISPVVNELDFIASDEDSIDAIENKSSVVIHDDLQGNDIVSVVNDLDIATNDVLKVVDDTKQEETFFSFSFTPEIEEASVVASIVNEVESIAVESTANEVVSIAVESILNEVESIEVVSIPNEVESIEVAAIVNELESIEVAVIVNEVETIGTETIAIESITNEFESITNEVETIGTESIAVESIVSEIEYSFSDADLDNLHEQMSQQLETTHSEQKVVMNNQPEIHAITFVDFSTNEIAIDPEREYTDTELDMLHEQLSKEIEASKPRVAEPVYVATAQVQSQHKVEANKTVSEPVLEVKPSIMEMIPWSSVFGIVASLMAVASAWFIWNSIQKPIAIDEFIDSKIAPMVSQVNLTSTVDNVDNTLSLAPADFIANEILSYVENPSIEENNFNFVNLSEQSKISAVVLESNGLTTLELEDGFFEDLGI